MSDFVWAKVVVTHPAGTVVKFFFGEAANAFQTLNKIVIST